MIIPKLHYISQGNSPEEHLINIQNACTAGIELVILGVTGASENEITASAKEARKITSHFQTRLMLSDDYALAKEIKADGVHLSTKTLSPISVRENLYSWQIIGATANTLQDCETLLAGEVDYIRLGIFKAEKSAQEAENPVLGLNGYTLITEASKTETPILAFGAITTADVKDLLETGISGIAVSTEITRDFNTIRTFNELLNASVTEEQRHSFKPEDNN
ncbi:MAG: thiamine phosphate synthase [Leeuwenhoekiella sp.]